MRKDITISIISFSILFLITVSIFISKKNTTALPSLKIVFLDIGQGDATFITFPDGRQMLVDCAIDARILHALGRVMPFYDRKIEYLVVTHPDRDHYGGCIDVMKRFEIGHIIYNGSEKQRDAFWHAFMEEIDHEKAQGAEYAVIDKEMIWNIASTTVHFLYPDASVAKDADSNNASIIIKLSFGENNVLLTADAEKELETYLVERYGDLLDVEVLKIGHHGSNTSSIQPFLNATTPDVAVISSGIENTYGHPSPRVLKRLERMGVKILRTDREGDILMTFKGIDTNIQMHTNNTNNF